MAEKTFQLEILTLQRLFLREQVRFLIAPGQEGVFEILPGHAPFIFALKPGPLRIRQPDGKDAHIAVGGGFLVVEAGNVSILTRSAEHPEEIDRARAAKAEARAQERLQKRDGVDVLRAQAALQRALARLKVAEYGGKGL
ncbi:MAG: ATP synthase F1 subunit epsilon [Verrucomicrobia bacterium]|nr:ATP synthase F1 subunit epsilon [Verrucomicrobiota bacterium]